MWLRRQSLKGKALSISEKGKGQSISVIYRWATSDKSANGKQSSTDGTNVVRMRSAGGEKFRSTQDPFGFRYDVLLS